MLKRVRLHRQIIQGASPRDRKALVRSIIDGVLADAEDLGQDHRILNSLKTCEVIGFKTGIEFLHKPSRKVRGLAFDMPALVLHDKTLPATWVCGVEATTGFEEVPVMKSPDVRDRYKWVNIMKKADDSDWDALKASVIKAAGYFNAEYKELGPKKSRYTNPTKAEEVLPEDHLRSLPESELEYELRSKDKRVQEFCKFLRETKRFKMIGLCPAIAYFKPEGDKIQLEAEWIHALSGPALLYAHKEFPLYLVAGFDIMYNHSSVAKIRSNRLGNDIFGITG